MVSRLVVVLGKRVEDGAEHRERETAAVGGRRRDRGTQVGAYLGEKHGQVRRLAREVDEQVVRCYELCELLDNDSCSTSSVHVVPFSGAWFSVWLPITSFLRTSSFLFSFSRSAHSDWMLELSSPLAFLSVSMYCASSSASSSKLPSMSMVVLGPGILSDCGGICLEDRVGAGCEARVVMVFVEVAVAWPWWDAKISKFLSIAPRDWPFLGCS